MRVTCSAPRDAGCIRLHRARGNKLVGQVARGRVGGHGDVRTARSPARRFAQNGPDPAEQGDVVQRIERVTPAFDFEQQGAGQHRDRFRRKYGCDKPVLHSAESVTRPVVKFLASLNLPTRHSKPRPARFRFAVVARRERSLRRDRAASIQAGDPSAWPAAGRAPVGSRGRCSDPGPRRPARRAELRSISPRPMPRPNMRKPCCRRSQGPRCW